MLLGSSAFAAVSAALPRSAAPPPPSSNRVHLANLERVLLRAAPPPPVAAAPAAEELSPPSPLPALRIPFFSSPAAAKEADDASLRRVLLSDEGPSPRGDISSSWRLLHGDDRWEGLLDPLHHDLRREIVRYGDFIHAAYVAFLSDPNADPGAPAAMLQLPDPSYRVTKPLFATSSVSLPEWVSAAAPWAAQRTSLVGYVAVCDSRRELRRMGRRDIVVALRGSATVLEWAENFRAGLVPVATAAVSSPARVERGFQSLLRTAGERSPSLAAAAAQEVARLVNKYRGEEMSITVTGHSLGAALAVLVADELKSAIPGAPPVAVFSFGGPRVGNRAFAAKVDAAGVRVLRVVNPHDFVTRVPPPGARSYADVGKELLVDHRASPFLRPDADAACCHDLEAYLHLVDGFAGKHCPYRANARRSLARLLEQQGGNVKKLYVSKARDLTAAAGRRESPAVMTTR